MPLLPQGTPFSDCLDAHDGDHHATLCHALSLARDTSHSPLSQFKVGAVALDQQGRLFYGTNLEFEGVGLDQCVHAEQYVVAIARQAGARSLEQLWCTEAPCGRCRQFLLELGQPELRLSWDNPDTPSSSFITQPLSTMLPYPFTLAKPGETALLSCPDLNQGWTAPLADLAQAHAYVPYTQQPSALALTFHASDTQSDHAVIGLPIESSAYNPTLTPVQVALIQAHSKGLAFESLQSAHLLESNSSRHSYEPSTVALLSHWNKLLSWHVERY